VGFGFDQTHRYVASGGVGEVGWRV